MMREKSNTVFIKREIFSQLLKWIDEREIIAIAGPRQSGKTTLLFKLKEQLKKKRTVYINFEETEQVSSFIKSPKDFIKYQLAEDKKTYFLFDEFQFVEQAGKQLKFLYDAFPQAKFIITGSSSLKIREIASYLVGRVIFFNLFPLSFAEFLSYQDKALHRQWLQFNQLFHQFLQGRKKKMPIFLFNEKMERFLEEYLLFGGYPAIAISQKEKKEKRLSSLVETYIEKDIIKYLKIGNYLEFKRLIQVLAVQVGNLVNVSSLSQDTTLPFREIKKFLSVFEQTFVIRQVQPFFTNKITEIRKSPKVYFIDLGLRNSLISDFREISLRADKGFLVENFAIQSLIYAEKNIFFWRTKQQAEVDVVLRSTDQIIPIEVKYQSFNQPKLSRGLASFLNTYQSKKAVVLTKNFASFHQKAETQILFLPIYFVS